MGWVEDALLTVDGAHSQAGSAESAQKGDLYHKVTRDVVGDHLAHDHQERSKFLVRLGSVGHESHPTADRREGENDVRNGQERSASTQIFSL